MLLAGNAFADESMLSEKWSYDLGSAVKSLKIGDVDGDNVSEVAVAFGSSVYIFSGGGRRRG